MILSSRTTKSVNLLDVILVRTRLWGTDQVRLLGPGRCACAICSHPVEAAYIALVQKSQTCKSLISQDIDRTNTPLTACKFLFSLLGFTTAFLTKCVGCSAGRLSHAQCTQDKMSLLRSHSAVSLWLLASISNLPRLSSKEAWTQMSKSSISYSTPHPSQSTRY